MHPNLVRCSLDLQKHSTLEDNSLADYLLAVKAAPCPHLLFDRLTELLAGQHSSTILHKCPQADAVLRVAELWINDLLWEGNAVAVQLAWYDDARMLVMLDVPASSGKWHD